MQYNPVLEQIAELECMQESDRTALKQEAAVKLREIREDAVLYYDEQLDKDRIKSYYAEIWDGPMDGISLFYRFHELLKKTHRFYIEYPISKDQYLYPWVDLQPDGRLQCIYSGEKKDPEIAIDEDFDTILLRFARFRQLLVNDRLGKEDLLSKIRDIAREHKFNTEHVVPRSWFHDREPMKGDLHHLFVCEPKCNNRRGNYPFYEFSSGRWKQDRDVPEHYCGYSDFERFEPNRGKGVAARAMLYFLLRYPGEIRPQFRYRVDPELLMKWHWQEPVTLYEKHRNAAIYEIQGNRNPLIDLPELAGQISFDLF